MITRASSTVEGVVAAVLQPSESKVLTNVRGTILTENLSNDQKATYEISDGQTNEMLHEATVDFSAGQNFDKYEIPRPRARIVVTNTSSNTAKIRVLY